MTLASSGAGRIAACRTALASRVLCLPGVLAIEGYRPKDGARSLDMAGDQLTARLDERQAGESLAGFPLIVLVDDSDFAARTLNNWLWVTFTRSNPAADVQGVGAFTRQKHWGCTGPVVIDARIKPHHAPPLEEDSAVTRQVDALGAPGGPLHGII